MQPERVILTYADYELLPDDGRHYEIHEGELSVTPAPTPEHQDASGNLNDVLRRYVKANNLGKVYYAPIDVILDDSTIVQPDLVYLERARLEQISRRGIEGPPTLVVEILSPSTTAIDRVRKRQLYARFAIPYYWIVDTDRRVIEAYVLEEGQHRVATLLSGLEPAALPPFPDLALDPREIWFT